MWVKRTPEEIVMAKRKHLSTRIRTAVFMGVLVAVLCAFVSGGVKFHAPRAISFNEIVSGIPLSIVLGIIVGIISYWFALRSDRQLVCPKCGVIKFSDNILQCSCGGHFENIEEMKWHEHKK